ncbi:FtsX-like permease family protein [Patescibacteria group bacterium]|nr:MAG: FtsX-like permease family protein [Patescibacteria group bacterium]
MLALLRIIKYALQDIWRNISLSFMTVFILVLMLLSVNTLWSLDVLTKEAVGLVKKQVDVSFYFYAGANPKDVAEIKKYLGSFPEVVSVAVQSPEDVLKSFKERHKDESDVENALTELGENPFGPTLTVKTKEPKDYQKIMTAMNVPEYKNLIEKRSFENHEAAIERLQNIINRIEKIVLGLTAMFAIISFLIIFNTIRVAINTQRVEISIKRLVGASNWFIRGPYIVESFLFTCLSVAATVFLVFFALQYLDPYLAAVLPAGSSLTNYYNSHIFVLFGVQTTAVLLLTIASSVLAMRKQLKV